jgi:sortase A
MRGVGLILLSAGAGTCLVGAVLGLMAWQGQDAARAEWEAARIPDERPVNDRPELTRLSLPMQGAEFFVWEGATRKNLLFGPAHVAKSGEPGGGGNCIIAAHRDTHFRILRDVRKNEPIVVEHGGGVFRYRIVGLHIISATDNSYYGPTVRPTLTLVTCYPFYYLGKAPKRFIVQAELSPGG